MDILNKIFEITQRIFSNWTALKLILEADMGTREEIETFADYTAEMICMNDELITSELAIELENYIEIKFNTEIDDGSCMQVAEELVRFYNYAKLNEVNLFQIEEEKLSPLQSWILSPRTQVKFTKEESNDEVVQSNDVMDVDGWMTVKNKKRH